jgi:AraC-like DNA-binding protein
VAGDGDVLRVTAEAGDVLLHPLERGDDVLETEVGGVREHAPVLRKREPAERAEPIVQGNSNGAVGRSQARCVRGGLGVRADFEPAAEDIDDHGKQSFAGVFGCPDVQVQAVLTQSVVGVEPADPAHYLVSAVDLPLTGQILDAENGQPYVAVSLVLDPALLADIALTMPQVRDAAPRGIGIAINPMTAPLRDTLLRLLSLLDTPADIPVLAPLAERELLYRLLQGPQGRLLRQIAQPEGTLGRIRRAVGWIRENHKTHLRIEALCDASGMSRASLHRHFLAITGLSPLQYHKQLRLQEARQLLLAGEHTASDVAFAVGYESASQFSREYLRQFGAPPARDVRQIRQAIGSPAMG